MTPTLPGAPAPLARSAAKDDRGQVHVVGAGVAGLACALNLARRGHRVTLYEAAPSAGGRCRALPDGSDNGTHALMGANHTALRFLSTIGAGERWVEPEPEGLPVFDLADGTARRMGLAPSSWRDPALRPPGLGLGGVLALAALALSPRDRAVAAAFAGHPVLHRAFVEPLTVAALNTPPDEASARRLGAVLRRVTSREAARLLVAREGLGPDLIEPALAALRAAGATLRFGMRLKAVQMEGRRACTLEFVQEHLAVGQGDAVVLALPPWEAVRLLPGVLAPDRFAPILNLHYAHRAPGPVRFLGMLGGLSQWVLVRPTGVSVTVSAADEAVREETDTLVSQVWREVRIAAQAFALPGGWPDAPPPARLVKERRATPRHTVGPPPRPSRQPLVNLALAGDWTWPALPATIEAAIRSGEAAAEAIGTRMCSPRRITARRGTMAPELRAPPAA